MSRAPQTNELLGLNKLQTIVTAKNQLESFHRERGSTELNL